MRTGRDNLTVLHKGDHLRNNDIRVFLGSTIKVVTRKLQIAVVLKQTKQVPTVHESNREERFWCSTAQHLALATRKLTRISREDEGEGPVVK
jgi:hypothetical protein